MAARLASGALGSVALEFAASGHRSPVALADLIAALARWAAVVAAHGLQPCAPDLRRGRGAHATAQALRRPQATLATDAGATGLMVAPHLGHATGAAPAVTHRSYVERDAARDAAVQRGLRVLQGGRRRSVPDPGSVETTVETDPNRGAATMAK